MQTRSIPLNVFNLRLCAHVHELWLCLWSDCDHQTSGDLELRSKARRLEDSTMIERTIKIKLTTPTTTNDETDNYLYSYWHHCPTGNVSNGVCPCHHTFVDVTVVPSHNSANAKRDVSHLTPLLCSLYVYVPLLLLSSQRNFSGYRQYQAISVRSSQENTGERRYLLAELPGVKWFEFQFHYLHLSAAKSCHLPFMRMPSREWPMSTCLLLLPPHSKWRIWAIDFEVSKTSLDFEIQVTTRDASSWPYHSHECY